MNSNICFRLAILFLAVILPVVFLIQGIYGSFLFTFSIPIVWQVVLRKMSFSSLGLRRCLSRPAVVIAVLSGCLMGFVGGEILRLFGITGHSFSNINALRLALGPWSVSFSLNNELGYRLLSASSSFLGLGIYFVFSVLAIGLGEELFWRGFIQQKINRYLSAGWAIFATSILFALIHFYVFTILDLRSGLALLLLIAMAGGIWGILFDKYRSIWPPAVSHGIAAFILWKYFFFV